MSRIPNYKRATNAAYQLLIQNPTFSLSTNVFYFIEHYMSNAVLLSYGQACFLYGFTIDLLLANSEFGFTIVKNNKRIILYNETCPMGCIRFTIAHEIGHAILGHINEHDPCSEKEANCFARNFLCPIPVVVALDCNTISDYIRLFNITKPMAIVSFDKRSADQYYIKADLFNTVSQMLDSYIVDAYMFDCVGLHEDMHAPTSYHSLLTYLQA